MPPTLPTPCMNEIALSASLSRPIIEWFRRFLPGPKQPSTKMFGNIQLTIPQLLAQAAVQKERKSRHGSRVLFGTGREGHLLVGLHPREAGSTQICSAPSACSYRLLTMRSL